MDKVINIGCVSKFIEQKAVDRIFEKTFFIVFAVLVFNFPCRFEAACSGWLVNLQLSYGFYDKLITDSAMSALSLSTGYPIPVNTDHYLVDKNLQLLFIKSFGQFLAKMLDAKGANYFVHEILGKIVPQFEDDLFLLFVSVEAINVVL